MSVQLWLRKNLFRSVGDSIVTVVIGSVLIIAVFRFLRFLFVTGRWEIVRVNLSLFITGSWPEDELWRLSATVIAIGFVGGLIAGIVDRRQKSSPNPPTPLTPRAHALDVVQRLWPALLSMLLLLLLARTVGPWILVAATIGASLLGRWIGPFIRIKSAAYLGGAIAAFSIGLIVFLNAGVSWNDWNGLVLNIFLALVSITLCFPIGVLMALGRRSEFPIVRWLSTIYIEVFRGVPLLALLLMANVALGFFIPQDLAPGKVVRALVILTLFTSAYVAEIVRGGLQALPKGQIEAGKANGLSPIAVTTRIVLPQAITNVIPALVGQFISLFKDTVLAGAALGLTDLLVAAEASTSQREFRGQGLIAETLVFVLLIFWAGSFTMSRESQRLEQRLGVSAR